MIMLLVKEGKCVVALCFCQIFLVYAFFSLNTIANYQLLLHIVVEADVPLSKVLCEPKLDEMRPLEFFAS